MINIIVAIDIIDGRPVRLFKGDYAQQKSYDIDPLDVAKQCEDAGLSHIHIIDLDGAKASSPRNLAVVERISGATKLKVQFGGGVKSADSLRQAFDAGVSRAIIGSLAVTDHALTSELFRLYGGDRFVLGADVKDGLVAINGWMESSSMTVESLIDSYMEAGLRNVICTDISKDGTLQGSNLQLYGMLQNRYPDLDIIASGGVASMDDLVELNRLGVRSVVLGKALYEGRISIDDIAQVKGEIW